MSREQLRKLNKKVKNHNEPSNPSYNGWREIANHHFRPTKFFAIKEVDAGERLSFL
jgi:hypothetical protein